MISNPQCPSPGGPSAPQLSVVAPVRNEFECLRDLHREVAAALEGHWNFELVLVDDGSTDGSPELIEELALVDPRVVLVRNRLGRGQTSALSAGFRSSRGALIAMLDADLQNDPADLPGLIGAMGDADAAVGYRMHRDDSWLRKVSSRIGNGVRNRLTGDRVRDTGCSLKVFRAEAIRSVALFEGMHRFLPTLLRWYGWSVVEVGVSHRPRQAGRSKYGVWNRALRGFADVLAVRWMRDRILRPSARSGPGEEAEPQATLVPHRPPATASAPKSEATHRTHA